MCKKTWLMGLALVALPLTGAVLLALGHSPPIKAGSLKELTAAEDTGVNIGKVSASLVHTWTHTTRAHWEQGTLEWLDSATISGSLQLVQRVFGASSTITPREYLGAGQTSPDIAVDADGNAYAVWSDGRNGHTDIYFAYRAAASATWSTSVKVNDDTGTAGQESPAIAVDARGNAYAVWGDKRNGDSDIYFATRPAGGPWEANVKVNDDVGTGRQSDPAIAVDASGNVHAIWVDERNQQSNVYCATRPAGGIWGANVRINDDDGTATKWTTAVAVDADGNTYATWGDKRNGDWDIYFAYRSMEGQWSGNTRINNEQTIGAQIVPSIAVDVSGNAYAIWIDARDSMEVCFAFRPVGGSWGARTLVDHGETSSHHPDIAVDAAGNLCAVWEDYDEGHYDIYLAYRSAAGATWSARVKVNDDSGHAQQWHPAVAADASGNAHVVWEDERNGNPDIYSAARQAGGAWGVNERVDDDVSGVASQGSPDVAVDSNGNAYAVWQDKRNGDGDTYSAYRAAVSTTWSTAIRVNDDAGAAWQYDPAIAVDTNGNAHAVWRDMRDGDWDIYSAYRPAGGTWGANVKVNDDSSSESQWVPRIAVDAAGNAYAAWADKRSGDFDVYFAYRATISETWSSNVRVNDDIGGAWQFFPDIAVDASGNAYVVWTDKRDGDNDIYFASRPAGGSWGTNVKVNDDVGTAPQWNPSIAVDLRGDLYAVWDDSRNGYTDVYFAYHPTSGSWGPNVQVNDSSGTLGDSSPSLVVDGAGNALAVWSGNRSGDQDILVATRLAGGSWGANIQVNDEPGAAWQLYPDIGMDSTGNICAVWEDTGYGATHIQFAQSLATPEYALEGSYTSPELDTGVVAATWGILTWQGNTPADTSLTFETRSRIAGTNWSEWQALASDSTIVSPAGQWLQYRIAFSTTSNDVTPRLDEVQISFSSVGTPSPPRFHTPCGATNQSHPTLRGSAVADSVMHLYANGSFAISTTVGSEGVFAVQPSMGLLGPLQLGTYVFTATAENERGTGPASPPLTLTVDPRLPYDPLNVRAGQWSKDGWLMSVPRDPNGCADPNNDWRVWPREDQKLRVEVPVSYTVSAAVTVTVGSASITLTEESDGFFAGVLQPPIDSGDFTIEVNADGATTVVDGGPVLIDPDGFVYEASGTINDTIPGAQVTCYYSDTHSGQWVIWDAWNYGQVNAQITLDDGYYSFYTPPGTYRVVAQKEEYRTYTSPALAVMGTPVRHNVPLERENHWVYLPLVLRGD